MVGDVESTLAALDENRAPPPSALTIDEPARTPPIPFASSGDIRDYLTNPRNAAILASYIMEQFQEYDASNYPREFSAIVLDPEYKKVVFWTPVAKK